MMVKGYKKLTDERFDNVSVVDGMNAGIKLHEMTRADAGLAEAAKKMDEMNRIINAVKEVVPERYFNEILARLESSDPTAVIEATIEEEDDDEDDEEFDPSVDDDDDGDW
jgi:hypothetical protein